jgi:autotransporter-associated beta strand protein
MGSYARTINLNGAAGVLTTVTDNGALDLYRGGILNLNANSNWTQNGSLTLQGNGGYGAALNVNSGSSFTYAGSGAINFLSSTVGSVGDQLDINGGTFTTGQGISFTQANGNLEEVILTGGGVLALSANIANFTTVVSGTGTEFFLGTGGGVINTAGFSTAISIPIINVSGQTGSLTVNGGGTVALTSTANAFTGGVTIDGATVSADAANALVSGGGAVTVNYGGTLRTDATGANLGGGAIALNNNGALQAGNGSTAAVSGTLAGVLTFNGNTYVNLDDNGSSTAALTIAGATTGLVRGSANGYGTLIINGATALNGSTDTLTITNFAAGANSAAPGTISNGILPGYEVGTVAGSGSAKFLTTVAGGANLAGSPIEAFTGYTNVTGATFTPTGGVVYDIQANTTMGSSSSAYAIKVDGKTLAGAANTTLTLGGGSTSQGALILNGTDTVSIPTIQVNGGELAVYTGGVATISSNILCASGGPVFTFFGPGTLTLTGSDQDTSHTGQPITIDGNVIANVDAPFVNVIDVNNGTFTTGSANIINGTTGQTLNVNGGGAVDLVGNNETTSSLGGGVAGGLIPGGVITSSSAGAVLILNNSSNSFYGNITSANLGLTQYGSNTENLDGFENYTGTTAMNGGTLNFAPQVTGSNDSLGLFSFAQGYSTVQSTYEGSGNTVLTLANVTRTAGATGNFNANNGSNGTTNKIVLTQFNGAAVPTATLLSPGLFYNGASYAAYDANGYVRAYGSGDANYVSFSSGASIAATSGTASNVNATTGSPSAQTSVIINTLQIGSVTVTFANNSQILQTNGILDQGGTPIIGGAAGGATAGNIEAATASGELVVRVASGTLVINSSILDNGTSALTVSGGTALALEGTNSYAGVTTVEAGTLNIGNGTAAGDLGNSSGVTLDAGGNLTFNRTTAYSYTNTITTGSFANGITITQAGTGTLTLGNVNNVNNTNTIAITRNAGSGALTLGTITGIGNLTDNSTNGSMAPTTVNQSGTGLTISTVQGASGSVVNLNSTNGSGSTTIANILNSTGQTVNFNGGTWTLGGGGGAYGSSIVINSGTVQTLNGGGQNFYEVASFTLNGGYFNDQASYGFRAGNEFGANGSTTNAFTGVQTGGLFTLTGNPFELGANSGANNYTYTLSSGTFSSTQNINLGANAAGTGQTTFTLSGGKLLLNATIDGEQGFGAQQAFVWTGGELAASAVNMTKLTSTVGVATTGTAATLNNGGGILAPGDIGTAGETTITGNYAVTNAAASLAIDLGGTNQATAFQNGSGYYDFLSVSGTATLGGQLTASLINSYTPSTSSTFTVLQAGVVAGTFTNANSKVLLNDPFSSALTITYGATTVKLSNFTQNEWQGGGSWGTGGTAVWTNGVDPNVAGAGAKFGAVGAAFNNVTLDQNRTVGQLLFSSTNYTISTSNSSVVTLDNGGSAATALVTVTSGTQALNTAVTLNSNLSVTGSSGAKFTVGGPITAAAAENLAVTGSGFTLQIGNGSSAAPTNIAAMSVASSGTLAFDEANTAIQSGSITDSGAVVGAEGSSITNTLSGAIVGTGRFLQSGAGTTILTGSNSYSGATTINSGGTLQLGDGTTDGTILGTSGITDNGTLVYDRVGSLSSGVIIAGSGAVTISGPGSQTFTAADTYSGATTINPGATLQLGNGVSSSSDGTVANSAITDNGTLVYNYFGAVTTSGTVTGSGNVSIAGPGSLSVSTNANLAYSGTTNVSGTLIVLASGALSGSLPNTSAVNIATGGVIDNDGTINSAATVNLNGGTLEGQGTVGSIVANSGTLAAGAGTTFYDTVSAGALTANGNVTLSSPATFSITLGVALAGDFNYLATTGTASLAGSLQLVLGSNFSDASGGGYLNMVDVILTDGALLGQFAQGNSITVYNSADSMYDTFDILYNVDASGNLGDGGTDVGVELISVGAIPEPGTWAMILSGAGMLFVAQRARRRSRNRMT